MSAPLLSRRDLEAGVRALIEAGRKRFLMAFYGRGTDDALDIDGRHVEVIGVRSELDLRRRLLAVPRDACAAFLIPWRAASLPIDLQGRFARDGKIEIVGPEDRLRARFGVREVDDDARECPLAQYILSHQGSEAFVVGAGRLTLDALWTTWLARAWNLDTGGELALDALLGWGAVDGRGPQFVQVMKDRNADAVRDALLDYLARRVDPAAPIVWRAWETGRGAALLELALVLGGLAGSTDRGVQMWTKLTSQQVLGESIDETVLARLGETADSALRFLNRRDAQAVRTLVLGADQRATDIAAHVAGSTRLPSAWRARLDRLGDVLAAIAANPTAASVEEAAAALELVRRHDMARERDQIPILRRAEMAVRLAAWLAVRPEKDLPASATPYHDAENLAGWYAREGGYLDRARRWARGGGDSRFAAGIAAVLAVVDDVRVELDRRFARALPDWHRAGRRATQMLPIDRAVHTIATAFLDENPDRKLLVILMDGMAWAQAVELLEAMGQRASVWGPLAWHGMAKHRIGEAPYPPVIANFPTITEVSRSAFFGGKPIPPGAPTSASNDPEKWKTNSDVKKHVAANVNPQLRLRGDGQLRDGSASPDALDLVMDPQQRIVAVVINAIDMSLKADRAHEVEWTLDTVKSLRDFLDKATAANRAVLLCSDHGHVPSDRLENAGVGEGARWRVWEDDAIADHEVALPAGDGVWAPRGTKGIVMIADDAHRYGGGTGSGEHGGASLAEVIAPCILIGCTDFEAAHSDPGHAVRPAAPPSWWFFDAGNGGTSTVAASDRVKKPRTKKQPEAQTAFPTFTPPPVAEQAPESVLAKSELFLARAPDKKTREQAVRAVELLRSKKGVVSAAAFAAELGEFAARVGGVVAKLQEILNVDGYQVLRFDRVGQQVILDVEKLWQQFDLG